MKSFTKARTAGWKLWDYVKMTGVRHTKLQLNLWDALIGSKLGYGNTIWSPDLLGGILTNWNKKDMGEIEKLQQLYMRKVLGVRDNTPIWGTYILCGRTPLAL